MGKKRYRIKVLKVESPTKKLENTPLQVKDRFNKVYQEWKGTKTSFKKLLRPLGSKIQCDVRLSRIKIWDWLKTNLWYVDLIDWVCLLPSWKKRVDSYDRQKSAHLSKLLANSITFVICGFFIFFLPFSTSGSAVLFASLGLSVVCPSIAIFGFTITGPVVAAVVGALVLGFLLTALSFFIYLTAAMVQSFLRFLLKGDRLSWDEVRKDWFLKALFGATYWLISSLIPAFKPIIVGIWPFIATYTIPGISGASIPILYWLLSGFFNAIGSAVAAFINEWSTFLFDTIREIIKTVELKDTLQAYFATSFQAYVQLIKGFFKTLNASVWAAIGMFIPTIFSGMSFRFLASIPIGLPIGNSGAIFQPWLNTRWGKVLHSFLLSVLTFGGVTFYAIQSFTSERLHAVLIFLPRKFMKGILKEEGYKKLDAWCQVNILEIKAMGRQIGVAFLHPGKLGVVFSATIAVLAFPFIWVFKAIFSKSATQKAHIKVIPNNTNKKESDSTMLLNSLMGSISAGGKILSYEEKRTGSYYELNEICIAIDSADSSESEKPDEIFVTQKELEAKARELKERQRVRKNQCINRECTSWKGFFNYARGILKKEYNLPTSLAGKNQFFKDQYADNCEKEKERKEEDVKKWEKIYAEQYSEFST